MYIQIIRSVEIDGWNEYRNCVGKNDMDPKKAEFFEEQKKNTSIFCFFTLATVGN